MLLIDNRLVAELLDIASCIDVQEQAFRGLATGDSVQRRRIDMYVPTNGAEGYYRWGSVDAAFDGILATRLKSDVITWTRRDGTLNESKHCIAPGTYCGLVLLFSTDDGAPLAIINDGHLQHMRVGAAAGLGARHLARADATRVGIIGSGAMARTYLAAFCAVRGIKAARVYSRSAENRDRFAAEMSKELGILVEPVAHGAEAAHGVEILALCTDSITPVLNPTWLTPGMHVTNLTRAEIPPQAMQRFDVVVRQGEDGLPLPESADFRMNIGQSPGAYVGGTAEQQARLPPPSRPAPLPAGTVDITAILTGEARGRSRDDEITYYRNSGNNGLQFAAVGGLAYRRAREAGVGHELPDEWFLQDIRN